MSPGNINRKLNKKERMFVEAYCGDTLDAARIAGYVGTEYQIKAKGTKLLSDPAIMEALKDRSKYAVKTQNVIATRDERMEMWTNVMNNSDPNQIEQKDALGIPLPQDNIPMNMRLKASELLGKAEGDFIDRVDFSGKVTISDVILKSYDIDDKSLEDIEAEYMVVREQNRLAKKKESDEKAEIEYRDEPEDVLPPDPHEMSLDDLL